LCIGLSWIGFKWQAALLIGYFARCGLPTMAAGVMDVDMMDAISVRSSDDDEVSQVDLWSWFPESDDDPDLDPDCDSDCELLFESQPYNINNTIQDRALEQAGKVPVPSQVQNDPWDMCGAKHGLRGCVMKMMMLVNFPVWLFNILARLQESDPVRVDPTVHMLDFFAGACHLTNTVLAYGLCAIPFDIVLNSADDILTNTGWLRCLQLLRRVHPRALQSKWYLR